MNKEKGEPFSLPSIFRLSSFLSFMCRYCPLKYKAARVFRTSDPSSNEQPKHGYCAPRAVCAVLCFLYFFHTLRQPYSTYSPPRVPIRCSPFFHVLIDISSLWSQPIIPVKKRIVPKYPYSRLKLHVIYYLTLLIGDNKTLVIIP